MNFRQLIWRSKKRRKKKYNLPSMDNLALINSTHYVIPLKQTCVQKRF